VNVNLPNILTLSRLLMSFVFMFLIFREGLFYKAASLGVFLIGAITDYWDGYLARKRGQISKFGQLLDPIADKVLIFAAFLSFVQLRIVPAWMVAVMLTREVLITGVRLLAAGGGTVIPAGRSGKHKTVVQITCVILILVYLTAKEFAFWKPGLDSWCLSALNVFMYWVVIITIFSGIRFAMRNRHLWR